jgi:tRNA (guanine-N7-)-methyltransferase
MESGSAVVVYGRRRPLRDTQRAEWERLWGRYGVPLDAIASYAPDIVDIGFGGGESTQHLAVTAGPRRVLGVERYQLGALQFLQRLDPAHEENVRICITDGLTAVTALPPRSVELVQVLHPDPWPKRRHAGRRLVNPRFLGRVAAVLTPAGVLVVETDNQTLAEDIARTGHHRLLERTGRPACGEPVTRYARRARDRGRVTVRFEWRLEGGGGGHGSGGAEMGGDLDGGLEGP